MAKRFITTDLFKDAWFMDLQSKYKLFWLFLITESNHYGIWQVNFKIAGMYVGDHLEPIECERVFKDRIIKIDAGKYWFIPKFIYFQYGTTLSKKNMAVRNVIKKLEENNLFRYLSDIEIIEDSKGASKELQRSLEAPKEKEKEKEKVKDSFSLKKNDLSNLKLEEVIAYGKECKIDSEVCKQFYYHYDGQGWVTSGENSQPVRNWQSKLKQWNLNQSKMDRQISNGKGNVKDFEDFDEINKIYDR